MEMKQLLDQRYTVKKFDKEFKLDEKTLEDLKLLLQQSPSSVNVQPWHFTLATTTEGIEKVAKSTANFGFNDEKIRDASALVVLSVANVNEDFLTNITEQEDKDGRYAQVEFKDATDNGRKYFWGMNKDNGLEPVWLSNQVYLNAGHFVMGAAAIGLDTVIMEGFDNQVLKQELGLLDATPVLIIGVGRGADDDYNRNLPKSRLQLSEILTEI